MRFNESYDKLLKLSQDITKMKIESLKAFFKRKKKEMTQLYSTEKMLNKGFLSEYEKILN